MLLPLTIVGSQWTFIFHRWTKLVKAVFKAHAGVPLAPKELRSSFITFLRSGHNSDAALKSAAFAMRHSSTQARGPAYDKDSRSGRSG